MGLTTPPGSDARDGDLPSLASRLRLAITRNARRLRQEAGAELTPTQMASLATVARHEPLGPSELAEIEGIRRPTATQVLDRLAERGLVERRPDPEDGRRRAVSATAAGRALLEHSRAAKDAFLARRLADLSREELRALADAAPVLESILEERE